MTTSAALFFFSSAFYTSFVVELSSSESDNPASAERRGAASFAGCVSLTLLCCVAEAVGIVAGCAAGVALVAVAGTSILLPDVALSVAVTTGVAVGRTD